MSEELKSCPFCESKNIKATDNNDDGSPLTLNNWAECDSCFATGPVKALRSQAITAWNGRERSVEVLTLDQIKEIRREERERSKNMVRRACDLGNIITPRQRDMIVSGIDSETVIREMGEDQ